MALSNRTKAIVLVTVIVAAHIALWASDRLADDVKLRLTVINAIGWGIVLIPAWLVSKWAEAHSRRRSSANLADDHTGQSVR